MQMHVSRSMVLGYYMRHTRVERVKRRKPSRLSAPSLEDANDLPGGYVVTASR